MWVIKCNTMKEYVFAQQYLFEKGWSWSRGIEVLLKPTYTAINSNIFIEIGTPIYLYKVKDISQPKCFVWSIDYPRGQHILNAEQLIRKQKLNKIYKSVR